MRRLLCAPVLLLLTALLVVRVGGVQAQSTRDFPQTPLMVNVSGGNYPLADNWAWTGSGLSERTANKHSGLPIVSPRGDSFAFLRVSPDYVALKNQNSDGIAPQDIYVMTFRTDRTVLIAGQPATTTFADGQMHYTVRSQPAWSPDGLALMWTESTFDQVTAQNADAPSPAESLIVYIVLTGKISTLISPLPAHRIINQYPLLSKVYPGPGGRIAVKVAVSPSIDPTPQQDWLYFYDAAGHEIAHTAHLETSDGNYQYSDIIWLNNLAQDYVGCVNCTTKIDPNTGVIGDLGGTPELYSPLAPNNLSLYYGQASNDEANVTWIIAMHGKPVTAFNSARISWLSDCAISPDGLQIVAAIYAGQSTSGSLNLYQARRNHTIQFETDVAGLSWGPMAWRIHRAS